MVTEHTAGSQHPLLKEISFFLQSLPKNNLKSSVPVFFQFSCALVEATQLAEILYANGEGYFKVQGEKSKKKRKEKPRFKGCACTAKASAVTNTQTHPGTKTSSAVTAVTCSAKILGSQSPQ